MCKFVLIPILLFFPIVAMPADWREYTSENFTVYSDVKPKHVVQQVRDFEVYRLAVLTFLGFENVPENKQARVYIFASDKEFREYAGGTWIAGYYRYQLNGPTMVMSRLKTRGKKQQAYEQNLVLFHEYVHYLLREKSGINFPKWYEEGLSDLLGAARVEKNKVGIGASNPWRHSAARGKTLLPIEELIEKPSLNSWQYSSGFYPTSWLLTHYLMFGHLSGEPNYTQRLRNYLLAHAQGAVTIEDFEETMGVAAHLLNARLQAYAQRDYLMGYSIPVKPYEGDVGQRKLSHNEVLYHKADLLINADRRSKANTLLEQSRKNKPFHYRNQSLLAVLYGRDGEHGRALELSEEALEKAGDDAVVLVNAAHVMSDMLQRMDSTGEWDYALYKRAQELGLRAYEHPQKSLEAARNLWLLYELGGDKSQAEKMMLEIYRVTPSRVDLNLQVAQFYIRVGDLAAALPYLSKVLAFSHDDVQKNEVAKQILMIKDLLAEPPPH